MVSDLDFLKQLFVEKMKRRVGEKYIAKFEENKVVHRESIVGISKDSKNSLFLGYTGTGKTMALIYLARLRFLEYELDRAEKLKEQKDCWLPHYNIGWFHNVELCRLIQSQAQAGGVYWPEKEIYIDDFGVSIMAPWEMGSLDYFFEMLYRKDVRIYMTTNLTTEELKQDQYRRIMSRITENCTILSFGQEDLRRKHD